ncbi:hypothetical protein ABFX02_06G198300 [Erythranthe guttata]
MGSSSRNPLIILHVLILHFVLILHHVNTITTNNHNNLVYTQCPNHPSPNIDPSRSSLISSLFQEFVNQSTQSRFFETIVADEKTAISGTFQCRYNLSPNECRSCVSKFPIIISKNICGKNNNNLPSRIQLFGCYAHYQEENGLETNSRPDQLLHRACSKRKIKKHGFEEMKYAAFSSLENDVMMSRSGFFETNYESIHVLAQCAGSLRACDCGECVDSAVKIAYEDECRYSISGEIYLESCFVSYDYTSDHGFGGYSDEDKGIRDGSPKLVAIVVGGLAVASLGLALCYCTKSCGKKRDDW